MQQRLVLRRRTRRRRHRRHRLHALALARQHQSRAIIAQRTDPILVANHARKPLNIRRKTQFSPPTEIQRNLLRLNKESRQITDSPGLSAATFYSVKLGLAPPFVAPTIWLAPARQWSCVASLSARITSPREIIPTNFRSSPITGKLRLLRSTINRKTRVNGAVDST